MPRPEPTTWFPLHEQPVQPAAAGGYIDQHGEPLISAHDVINTVHPHDRLHAHRNGVVLRACAAYAGSRHNPVASSTPWQPTVEPFKGYSSIIEPLIRHVFWDRVEVLAAPITMHHARLPLATAAELLVRFRDGEDLGIGLVETAPKPQLNALNVAARAGAAIALLGDTYGWWPRRAFVLYCRPDETTIDLVDVDRALLRWMDAIDSYRFLSRKFAWEKRL